MAREGTAICFPTARRAPNDPIHPPDPRAVETQIIWGRRVNLNRPEAAAFGSASRNAGTAPRISRCKVRLAWPSCSTTAAGPTVGFTAPEHEPDFEGGALPYIGRTFPFNLNPWTASCSFGGANREVPSG